MDSTKREIHRIAIETLQQSDSPMSITDLRYAVRDRVPWPEELIREVVFEMVRRGSLKIIEGQKVIPRC
jgi:hypothetical protein